MSVNTEKTRRLFSSLIQRPPLSDQLLQRPPFKFLHDVVNSTIQTTGFLKNLYSADELNSTKITDKTGKIVFLEKLIETLNDDRSLRHVKATKIVAGKEPENTNLLLQKLANDAVVFMSRSLAPEQKRPKDKESSDESHKDRKSRYAAKKERIKPKEKCGEEKHERERSVKERRKHHEHSEKERKSTKDIETVQSEQRKNTEKEKRFPSKTHKQKRKDLEEDHSGSLQRVADDVSDQREENTNISVERVDESTYAPSSTNESSNQKSEILNGAHEQYHANREAADAAKSEESGINGIVEAENHAHLSIQHPTRPMTSSNRPQTSSGRPGTAVARQAPPKLKRKQIEETAPKVDEAVEAVAIIIEERKEDEDDDDFIVQADTSVVGSYESEMEQLELNEHGVLVRKIIEAKRELNDTDLLLGTGAYVLDESEHEKFAKKIDFTQKTIQQLTRTTYPLTQIYDYLQDDVESMINEMSDWRNETKRNIIELRNLQVDSNGEHQNLTSKLNELESEIREVKNSIARIKPNIFANDKKIHSIAMSL